MTSEQESIRLLIIDDDPAVLHVYKQGLARHGVIADTATGGREGAARVATGSYNVIVSDISMPEMTGLDFLMAVRAHDVDVPVILMTGEPGVESAVRAVEYGAFRYLAKPVTVKDLYDTVSRAARMHKIAQLKREARELPGMDARQLGERAALEVRFSRAQRRLWIAFQPIIGWREREVIGYEALLRSDDELMRSPADILDAATRLGHLHQLGRTVRAMVAAEAEDPASGRIKLFVNLHTVDLSDDDLYSRSAPLSQIASRVVLEVTERASLYEVNDVAGCVARLKGLGFQIALDDLGAGYAGLTSFTQLDPEIAKLDMTLVRGIDVDLRRQSIVRSMKSLCDDLEIMLIAEGVESTAERDTLAALGCNLFQGHLFARPARGFEVPTW